jgi:hypothetical protein
MDASNTCLFTILIYLNVAILTMAKKARQPELIPVLGPVEYLAQPFQCPELARRSRIMADWKEKALQVVSPSAIQLRNAGNVSHSTRDTLSMQPIARQRYNPMPNARNGDWLVMCPAVIGDWSG